MITSVGPHSSLREAESLWKSLVNYEPQRLPGRTRQDLVANSRCLDLSTDTLRVALDAARVRAWIEDSSLGSLGTALHAVTAGTVELALIPLEGATTREQDSSYSFTSFITSPSNQPAFALASEFARQRDCATTLFIHGRQGSGKSHLLRAIAAELDLADPAGEVIYCGAEELSLELIGAIWNNHLAQFRRKLGDASALLVDDVDALAGREATQDELAHSLKRLAGVPVVFSASDGVERVRDLIAPLHEQLQVATSLELLAPEWETRVAIVLDHIRRWQVAAAPEVASFLAGELRSDLRRVDAVLTRLLTHPSCKAGLSDLEVVRHLLQGSSGQRIQVTPESVISTVARHFNLRQRDLRSSSRSRRIASPRQIAMYLIREHCALSYPEIGRRFGRHHTTALHSVRMVKHRLDDSGAVRAAVALLEKELLRWSEKSE